jgi:hypothetical protein
MAEQDLNGPNVRSRFQQVYSERVAHRMGTYRFPNVRDPTSLPARQFDSPYGDGLAGSIALKQPVPLWPYSSPIGAQRFQQSGRQHDVAVLLTLALFNANHHSVTVDISGLQLNRFRDAQSCGVARGQDGSMLDTAHTPRKCKTSSGLNTTGSVCGFLAVGITSSKVQSFLRETL